MELAACVTICIRILSFESAEVANTQSVPHEGRSTVNPRTISANVRELTATMCQKPDQGGIPVDGLASYRKWRQRDLLLHVLRCEFHGNLLCVGVRLRETLVLKRFSVVAALQESRRAI